jgi:hypothetical protein
MSGQEQPASYRLSQKSSKEQASTENNNDTDDDSSEQESMSPLDKWMQERKRALRRLAFKHRADIAVYSAEINRRHTDKLIGDVFDAPMTQNRNVILALQTDGGVPAAGYRLARILQRGYDELILLIFETNKSAGTLIALGADQILMGPFAELGPLDVQRRKEGEILLQSSVLDIQKSLYAINSYSLDFFANSLAQILRMGGNAITTERATNLASDIATDLLEPIASQIDPIRLGEDERKIEIARKYGSRLLPESRDDDIVYRLTDNYPSHGFVIDITEAEERFEEGVVSEIGEEERQFEECWPEVRGDVDRPIVFFQILNELVEQTPSDNANSRDGREQEVQSG